MTYKRISFGAIFFIASRGKGRMGASRTFVAVSFLVPGGIGAGRIYLVGLDS